MDQENDPLEQINYRKGMQALGISMIAIGTYLAFPLIFILAQPWSWSVVLSIASPVIFGILGFLATQRHGWVNHPVILLAYLGIISTSWVVRANSTSMLVTIGIWSTLAVLAIYNLRQLEAIKRRPQPPVATDDAAKPAAADTIDDAAVQH